MPVLLPHRVAESRVQGFVTDFVLDHVKKIDLGKTAVQFL